MSDDARASEAASSEHAPRALAPGALCARHPERAATGRCHACGTHLCGLCARRLADRLYCEACADRTTRGHGSRAARAFVLGVLGVHGLFFLGPIAAVLGALELAAIRAGRSPVGGRGIARAALALGLCGIAMPVSILVVVFGGG